LCIGTTDKFRELLLQQAIKKKRASKVGFGRDDDDDDDKKPSTTMAAAGRTAQAPSQAISSLRIEEEGVAESEHGDQPPTVPSAVHTPISTIPLNILAAMASTPQPTPAFR
jgi:hypothetical protein